MFERNKVDNSQQLTGIAVEITRDDGTVEKGKLVVAQSSRIADVLNGPVVFLEFETYEGRRSLIAKSSLTDVRIAPAPGATSLQTRLRDGEFDPYKVLGLEPGASWEVIRAAYHEQAKAYHPDRYANAELPKEVRDYLAIMARRITAAYAALEPVTQAKRQAAKLRTEPVYTSQPR
jgi:hypothetical protein